MLPNSDAVLTLKPGNAILRAGTCVRILVLAGWVALDGLMMVDFDGLMMAL